MMNVMRQICELDKYGKKIAHPQCYYSYQSARANPSIEPDYIHCRIFFKDSSQLKALYAILGHQSSVNDDMYLQSKGHVFFQGKENFLIMFESLKDRLEITFQTFEELTDYIRSIGSERLKNIDFIITADFLGGIGIVDSQDRFEETEVLLPELPDNIDKYPCILVHRCLKSGFKSIDEAYDIEESFLRQRKGDIIRWVEGYRAFLKETSKEPSKELAQLFDEAAKKLIDMLPADA